ncbi:unnamed protein product [Prorocentrum cordatum]|uniref:Uncharacterized protein n=1 Tax=Prorocentrum cordatum TaxID=2364126 RepID=A0ABN9WJ29_9DINO|nr:unnamed protein product [Polarella glacialis]
MADWLLPSAMKRAGGVTPVGTKTKAAKGEGKGDASHANARLLRQLESRVRTLEFGAGLTVHGPSDAEVVTVLQTANQECQKKVEGKANPHGLGPPELQTCAALLNVFSGRLEKKGTQQDSAKYLTHVPNRLLLMMQKGDMPTASTWIKECNASRTQNESIGQGSRLYCVAWPEGGGTQPSRGAGQPLEGHQRQGRRPRGEGSRGGPRRQVPP